MDDVYRPDGLDKAAQDRLALATRLYREYRAQQEEVFRGRAPSQSLLSPRVRFCEAVSKVVDAQRVHRKVWELGAGR
jgi:hypothetical protein